MKNKWIKIIYFLCNIIFLSCSPNILPKFNQINTLRVIALTTPTPEVSAGDTVTVTPVISDINSVTALTYTAQVCIDLGIAYGLMPTCEGNPTRQVIHTNQILTLPGIVDQWTGNADTFTFVIPSWAAMFSGKSAQDQFNGVNYLVEYILVNSNGQTVKSFRRIIVSNKTPKNINPNITDFFSNGVSMITLPVGYKVNLTSDLSASSIEAYQIKDLNNLITTDNETLSVTWMITDGETKYFRSGLGQANEYTGPMATPTGRSAYIFALARDNRGGVTVVRKKF